MRNPLPILALVALAIVAYWPGLSGPFILDDGINLQPLQAMDAEGGSLLGVVTENQSGVLGRPVSMMSFALNYRVSGLDPFAFKLVNLLIHGLCGFLLYFLSLRVLAFDRSLRLPASFVAAFIAGFWLLSPLFVSTVLYPVQRMAQLSTLFSLATLLFYVQLRSRMIAGQLSAGGLAAGIGGLLLLGLLALGSKENAVMLPLLCLLLEVGLITSPAGLWREPVLRYGYLLIFGAAAVVLGFSVSRGLVGLVGYQFRDFSLVERLMTESRVLWEYVRAILLPDSASLGVYHDDIAISRGLLQPPSTAVALIAWAGVLLGSLRMLTKPRWRGPAAGVLFFLAAHALESTVLPLEIYFEHRNYLPAWGLLLAVALLIDRLLTLAPQYGKLAFVVLALLMTLFAFSTWQRSVIWSDGVTMITTTYDAHPNSPRLNSEMANMQKAFGDLDGARNSLLKVAELKPAATTGTLFQLLRLFCSAKRNLYDEDWERLEQPLRTTELAYSNNSLLQLNVMVAADDCGELDVARAARALAYAAESTLKAEVSPHFRLLGTGVAKLLISTGHYERALLLLQAQQERLGMDFDSRLLQLRTRVHIGDREGAELLIPWLDERAASAVIRHRQRLEEAKSQFNERFN